MSAKVFILATGEQDNTVAVGPFPSQDAAQTWEDEHPDFFGIGLVRVVSPAKAAKGEL